MCEKVYDNNKVIKIYRQYLCVLCFRISFSFDMYFIIFKHKYERSNNNNRDFVWVIFLMAIEYETLLLCCNIERYNSGQVFWNLVHKMRSRVFVRILTLSLCILLSFTRTFYYFSYISYAMHTHKNFWDTCCSLFFLLSFTCYYFYRKTAA